MRMFFLMALSLWTSRLFLQALGIDNFGIYNIVGGVMVMFSFLNSALTTSTRRFINYFIGEGNPEKLKTTFSTSLYIHLLLCILILFLGETIGLWFVNSELNIPTGRMYAANWVFQLSVLSSCIGIIGSPFEGAIIAEEKMSVYAYISILETVFKVVILLFLIYFNRFDTLIAYATLFFVANVIITLIKWVYCTRKFPYCTFRPRRNPELFKDMLTFSGWSVFGQVALMGSSVGLNMLVNIFYGVALNAAMGIANQVSSAVSSFSSNFQTAFNPQVVQTYSQRDLKSHRELISKASRVSFMLMLVICLPVIFNIDYLLSIWLTEVPQYTSIFAVLSILFVLIESFSAPLWMSMQAVGNIRIYQLIISLFHFSTFILSYICLKMGFLPWSISVVSVCVQLAICAFRVSYILPKSNFRLFDYFKKVLIPVVTTLFIAVSAELLLENFSIPPLIKLISQILVSILIGAISYRFIITSKCERETIKSFVRSKLCI